MKKIAFAFLLSFLLLALSVASFPAFAQALTATPYPTFYPTQTAVIYSFPTNYACPTGLPSGYGTVTPDAFWEFSCSHCVLPALSTSTPFTTPTVDPLVTPSPVPSTSPSPAPYSPCDTGVIGGNNPVLTLAGAYASRYHYTDSTSCTAVSPSTLECNITTTIWNEPVGGTGVNLTRDLTFALSDSLK